MHLCAVCSCVELIPRGAWRHRDPEGSLLLLAVYLCAPGVTGLLFHNKASASALYTYLTRDRCCRDRSLHDGEALQ
eukprot:1124098-Pleurochrysis_carterae.AAC.2